MSKKIEELAKKRRKNPVYSSTYGNKKMRKKSMKDIPEEFYQDLQSYVNSVKPHLLRPENKNTEVEVEKACCDKPLKTKNVISKSLKFWFCKKLRS